MFSTKIRAFLDPLILFDFSIDERLECSIPGLHSRDLVFDLIIFTGNLKFST